jgi:hypothetical protein
MNGDCPPGNKRTLYSLPRFDEAVAVVKRVVYGQRYTIQGQTLVTTPRNSPLVAAMWVENLSLVPGMRSWYKRMQRRCGQHTPCLAWAFEFGIPNERSRLLALLRHQDRACVVRVLSASPSCCST